MLFKLLVAAYTGKVRVEPCAGASLAPGWSVWSVFHVRVLANTRSTPRIDVKTFPSRKPVLSNLFWSSWDKLKCFALTTITVVLHPTIFLNDLIVSLKKMAAEAAGVGADSETLILPHLLALPSHVDSTLHRFIGVVNLPG